MAGNYGTFIELRLDINNAANKGVSEVMFNNNQLQTGNLYDLERLSGNEGMAKISGPGQSFNYPIIEEKKGFQKVANIGY